MQFKNLFKKILKDLPLKIIAIVLAIILWYYVSGIKNSERIIDIPLEIVNLPENVMIVSPLPNKVTVKLRGPRNLLYRVSSEKQKYKIDVKGLQIGTNMLNFSGDELDLPQGVQIVWISPGSLTITMSETVRKKLVVVPRIVGTPGKGYKVVNYTVTPAQIEIIGTKESLNGIEKVYTKEIDVTGETENLSSLFIQLDVAQFIYKYIETDTVSVDIVISPNYITKVLSNVRVIVKNGTFEYHIFPETVDVEISGPENYLEAFPLKEIEAYINIEGMKAGVYRVRPVVKVPDNVRVETIRPEEIELTIRKKEQNKK